VYITAPGGSRKLCKAVNLSATGVFIETSNLGLHKGQQVVLSFAISLGVITKLHRRTAWSRTSRRRHRLMMETYAQARAESCAPPPAPSDPLRLLPSRSRPRRDPEAAAPY